MDVMYTVVRATGNISILYMIIMVIFGQIILLKLFLAVLLENFEEKRKELENEKKRKRKKKVSYWALFKDFIYYRCFICKKYN